jgi:hypothetical protein
MPKQKRGQKKDTVNDGEGSLQTSKPSTGNVGQLHELHPQVSQPHFLPSKSLHNGRFYTDSNQDRNDIIVKEHMRILFLIIHWITPSRHLPRIGMLIIRCLRGKEN